MSQMKEQDKSLEKQLNEKINNYVEEFRITGKIIQDLRKKNGKDARNVWQRPRRTKEQTEMNNTLEGKNN